MFLHYLLPCDADERHCVQDCVKMLANLTELTRQDLHEVEGTLWIPWAVAQRINAAQKVNASIEYVRCTYLCSEFTHVPPTGKASKVGP